MPLQWNCTGLLGNELAFVAEVDKWRWKAPSELKRPLQTEKTPLKLKRHTFVKRPCGILCCSNHCQFCNCYQGIYRSKQDS